MVTPTTGQKPMARKQNGGGPEPGQPPGKRRQGKSKLLRVKLDLGVKVALVCRVTQQDVADYIGRMIRDEVETDYARFKPEIDALLALQSRAKKKMGEQPGS